MKNFLKLFFILVVCALSEIRAEIVQTTMYACCSPYGLCDLRLFSQKTVCQQICGGHNQCVAKTSNVIRHPLYGLPVAHISPNTSAYITGLTSEAEYMAATGGESMQYNAAPRPVEITVRAPIAEESRR
jgi:hypothetical protein